MRGRAAAIMGLVLALGGPALVAIAGTWTRGDAVSVPAHAASVIVIALIVAAVLVIAGRYDGIRLRQLGFAHISWWTPVIGLALAVLFITVFGPLASWMMAKLNTGGFEVGLAEIAQLPRWYLALVIAIVAPAEEFLYRAFAIERLEMLTGSTLIASAISLVAFGLAHVPLWGWAPALTTLVSGGILTLVYVWRRDVVALMIGHVITDLFGIL
jgi:membrane protease YdiL (CAAX protease family)